MNVCATQHTVFRRETRGLLLVGLLLLWRSASRAVRADPGLLFVTTAGNGTDCSQANPCSLATALGLERVRHFGLSVPRPGYGEKKLSQ